MEFQFNFDDFDNQFVVKNQMCKVPDIKYPIKLLRYFICSNLIESELVNGASIAEIGIDRGQMQRWLLDCGRVTSIDIWDGYDVDIKSEVRSLKYSNLIEGDVTQPEFSVNRTYDVFVLVHFLEHLHNPEQFLEKIGPSLNVGGSIVGGMPVTPQIFAHGRERKIRKTAKPFGHVSVFSPERIKEFAHANGYDVELISGAFLARMSDKSIENSLAWLKFNLWFGQKFPSLGGEIYFKLRKKA